MSDLTELEAAEKYSDEMEQAVGRTLSDAEREFVWRGYGFDIDNPLALISGSR